MSYRRNGVSKSTVFTLSLVLVLTHTGATFADVRLPAVIGNNMVIQEGIEVPVWGWAEPGEKVRVKLDQQKARAAADGKGKWMVKIGPFKAGGPFEMTIKGKNTITVRNIMVGEVWICSGQSNMQWSLDRAADAEQEIAAANYPSVRLFTVERNVAGNPADDCVGSWSECSPDTAAKFSAVAYFFGRYLHKELNVPVGLINTSWGGTRIEPWTPPVGFASVPSLREIRKKVEEADDEYRKNVTQSLDSIEAWVKDARKALAANEPVPSTPVWPAHPLSNNRQPTGLYNAMVHPLAPYGIRGAIWY